MSLKTITSSTREPLYSYHFGCKENGCDKLGKLGQIQ